MCRPAQDRPIARDRRGSLLGLFLLDTRAQPRLIFAVMSQRKTTFGLTLSNRAVVTRGTQPKDLIDMAVRAEASGRVQAVWVGDSILSKPRLECMPLLGAIAGHTSRLRLGVACMATLAQRNPVLLALQWASLDVRRTHVACSLHGIPGEPTSHGRKRARGHGHCQQRATGETGRDDPGPARPLVG